MSRMDTVDENGHIRVGKGSLKSIQDDHPAWKARNALSLGAGEWLYAPLNGHTLRKYDQVKYSDANVLEFEKSVQFYLKPYGTEVQERFAKRGELSINALITKETIDGQSI